MIQIVWGAALLLAGIGVFYRIPGVMPMISEFEKDPFKTGFIKFSFYIVGVILIGGGIKKIIAFYKQRGKKV